MALLTDPDSLTQGTEVTITEGSLTIDLNVAGNLSADGVTGQCLYSFLKEEWLSDTDLPPYAFPLDAVTPEQFVWLDDWVPADDAARKLLRNCGWVEKSAAGATTREYCGIISVPPTGVEATDQPYYEHVANTPTDFTRAGPVNEVIQTYGDASNGDFDRRTTDVTVFCREEQKTYASASVFANYSITTLGTGVYRVGLSVATDPKASVADTGIDANSDGTADVDPYDDMVFTKNAVPVSIAMSGGSYDFTWTLDCNGAAVQRAYEYLAWLLRKNSDIDAGAGTLNGKTAPTFGYYVGDTFYTSLITTGEGVALTNFSATDINGVSFVDDTGAARTFDYTAALTISFSAALQNDVNAKYWVYPTADFGAPGCTEVLDASDAVMSGEVPGATVTHTYNWTEDGDVGITVVALGTSGAKYKRATGAIVQSTANAVSVDAGEESVYVNPA